MINGSVTVIHYVATETKVFLSKHQGTTLNRAYCTLLHSFICIEYLENNTVMNIEFTRPCTCTNIFPKWMKLACFTCQRSYLFLFVFSLDASGLHSNPKHLHAKYEEYLCHKGYILPSGLINYPLIGLFPSKHPGMSQPGKQ